MRKSRSIAPTTVANRPTTVAARTAAFLRARHPNKTAHAVAARTGLPAATVSKWFERRSAPSAPHLLVLVGAYGPAFLSALYRHGPAWLDVAARAEERFVVEAEIDRLTTRLKG